MDVARLALGPAKGMGVWQAPESRPQLPWVKQQVTLGARQPLLCSTHVTLLLVQDTPPESPSLRRALLAQARAVLPGCQTNAEAAHLAQAALLPCHPGPVCFVPSAESC
jgi:hypothetical protein